jgi:hypothetical protein
MNKKIVVIMELKFLIFAFFALIILFIGNILFFSKKIISYALDNIPTLYKTPASVGIIVDCRQLKHRLEDKLLAISETIICCALFAVKVVVAYDIEGILKDNYKQIISYLKSIALRKDLHFCGSIFVHGKDGVIEINLHNSFSTGHVGKTDFFLSSLYDTYGSFLSSVKNIVENQRNVKDACSSDCCEQLLSLKPFSNSRETDVEHKIDYSSSAALSSTNYTSLYNSFTNQLHKLSGLSCYSRNEIRNKKSLNDNGCDETVISEIAVCFIFSPLFSFQGFFPWHLKNTEFFHISNQLHVRDAVKKMIKKGFLPYAETKQRHGK